MLPAIMHGLIHRRLDDGARRRLGRSQSASQVNPIQAQHHVRPAQQRCRVRAGKHGSRRSMQGVRRRKGRSRLHIRQHGSAQPFGKPHPCVPAFLGTGRAPAQDQRRARATQRGGSLRQRGRIRRGCSGRTVARHIRKRNRAVSASCMPASKLT